MRTGSSPNIDRRTARRIRSAVGAFTALVVACATLAACGSSNGGGSSSSGPIKVGAIWDLSGPLSVIGKPKADATKLAIKEINENGGVLGRQLKLVSYDAQSDTAKYTSFANTLIQKDRVEVLEAGITSASREAMRPLIDRAKIPYLYANLYEGGVCDKYVFSTGAVPSQQLAQLIPYAAKNFGKKFYILAADYNFGHYEATWAKKYIEESGGTVASTEYQPLEQTDFNSSLSKIQSAKPDVVVSLLVGGAQQGFYRQFAAAGLQNQFKIVTPVFGDGQEQQLVGPKATNGVVVAYPYLQELNTPANTKFRELWRNNYGDQYINPSAVSAYNAWLLWAAAVKKAGSLDRDKVIKALESGITIDSPAGPVTMNGGSHHVTQNVYVGEGQPDGTFKVIDTFDNVAPSYENENCDLIAHPSTNKQFIPSE